MCRLEREALEQQLAEAEERTTREVENRVRREAEQEMRQQIEERERAMTERMERFANANTVSLLFHLQYRLLNSLGSLGLPRSRTRFNYAHA